MKGAVMRQEHCSAAGVPAILWGEPAENVYLFVHSQGGSKEGAEAFSALACGGGWQVLSIDLPGHGARTAEADSFDPWHAVPELRRVMDFARARWKRAALRADSIGAWFSLLAFADIPPARSLFVSPVLDMERLIEAMMRRAGVTEDRLERERTIPTDFGQTLSWDYLQYVRRHPVTRWESPTCILCAARDELAEPAAAEDFARRFSCRLTVTTEGEHWFHTPRQLEILAAWEKRHAFP